MNYPKPIQNLINYLTRWPSVGPKTAERYVFYLLNRDPEELQKLAQTIAELREGIKLCKFCHAVAESSPCPVCADKKRATGQICVVANTRDMLSMESTGEYRGLYHVLGGVINSIEEVGPEKLNVKSLEKRIKELKPKEIILALSPNFEGETTGLYLKKLLSPYKIKITRLARGLPSGSELEYTDEATLGNAFKNRNLV